MTPDALFQIANLTALAGWSALAAGVLLRRPWLRDTLAGRLVPLLLSAGYVALLAVALPGAEGGFSTLAGVASLFASPWLLLAGWVHYLAFDLFVGSRLAAEAERRAMPRWTLLPVLPATFLLGPLGLLLFALLALGRRRAPA